MQLFMAISLLLQLTPSYIKLNIFHSCQISP